MESIDLVAYSVFMKIAILPLALSLYCLTISAQQNEQPASKEVKPTPVLCDAAAPALRAAGTNQFVLTMIINERGRVLEFTTYSPKGLQLEKIKPVVMAIKAIPFSPAMKDTRPVQVMVRAEFDCSAPATDASEKQKPH